MGQVTIDEFMKRFGGSLSPTAHPNKMILGKGVPNAHVVKWCNDCRNMWPGEYKVAKEVWESVVPTDTQRYLCLSCLDQHVSRHRGYGLDSTDFPEAPVNAVLHWAYERGRSNA